MTRHSNRSFWQSLQNLNIGVSLALMFFAISGLVMTGLALDVVEMMTQYKFLPLTASLGAYALTFAASGTRDPRYYHPTEWIIVTLTGVLMVSHTFLVEVQNLIAQYDPWASMGVMTIMVVTGAILAR